MNDVLQIILMIVLAIIALLLIAPWFVFVIETYFNWCIKKQQGLKK